MFAGCVGAAEGSEPLSDPGGAAPQPEFDEETGSIKGGVYTDELEPIAGAQVGVAGTSLTGMSDEVGAYVINYVPPGKHSVAVVALGYESASRTVEVVAGAVAERVDFLLPALPVVGPHHTTGIFKLIVGGVMIKATHQCFYLSEYGVNIPPNPAGVSNANAKTCQGTNSCTPSGQCEIHYGHCGDGGSFGKYGCDFTPDWKTIIGEVSWVPGSLASGRGWSWEILAPNVSRASTSQHTGSVDQSDRHDWWTLSSKNPIRTRIQNDESFMLGSPSGRSGVMKEEDRCGGREGNYAEGRCDWVWRIFNGWCTINALTGGLVGCEQAGPDFAVDQQGAPVTVYFTYFIGNPAPPDWTALPDT